MKSSLRKSLGWLHTWAGIVFGSVLFAIFWTGSLSVFDREIDQWMIPGLRSATVASTAPSLDRTVVPVANALATGEAPWDVFLPDARNSTFRLYYAAEDGTTALALISPVTGELLSNPGSKGGSGFFFPFHANLLVHWRDVGYWVVGLCGMVMLVLLVSGVVIHKRIFADFFTFRPRKAFGRSLLDLHNLGGVLALPFHFLITSSGLAILISFYFPQAPSLVYADRANPTAAYFEEAFGVFQRPRSGQNAPLASLDGMLLRAEQSWRGGRVGYVRVWHPGDASSYVEVRRSYEHEIEMNLDQIYFDAASGAVLDRFDAAPVMSAQRFLSGLHFAQFDHWTLRWLYFLGGISGCVMIATGMLFWINTRRARHKTSEPGNVRAVEALAMGSISGIVIATLGLFAANRLLPEQAQLFSRDRAALETGLFFSIWVGALLHAGWRMRRLETPSRAAWLEQTWAIAILSALCVLLNALTTGDHLARSYAQGLYAIAGMDTLLLAACLCSITTARKLSARQRMPAVTSGATARPNATST